ncbi:exonuclease [Streptomyces phage Sentinel]|uniref:Putative exonuclease n=1 Tax=Streptomyces phage Sentinel TaxID=2767584 RepID=A0A873WEK4_9CAUD|nr:exonuclease [Streptomyces phage Sentinel]QPB09860.1 putative exonuclease [Streptomyces phage Sentinel]
MALNLMDLPQAKPLHPNLSVPRDGWGRPLVVPPTGGKPKGHTRTTTFIDCIEDKSSLFDWAKRMVLVGAARRPELVEQARHLSPEVKEDKASLDSLVEQLTDSSGANDKSRRGTYLHDLTEYVDRGEPLPRDISGDDLDDMAAYMAATSVLSVVAVEQFVIVPELGVGGTFDRLSYYEGPGPDGKPISGNFITDTKTGSVEYGKLKMASQLAVYSRGVLYDHTKFPVNASDKKAFAAWKKTEFAAEQAAEAYSPLPPVNQDWGIIVHLPAGTGTCDLYWVDLNIGWALAQLALTIRKTRSTKGAMKPFVSQVTQDGVASVAASV